MRRLLVILHLLFLLFMHRRANGLRLLLIRHAQSQNNVIAKQMAIKYEGQSHSQMRKEFEKLRSYEPDLSEVGSRQADALKDYMLRAFEGLVGQPIPVYCSHMIRTLYTSKVDKIINANYKVGEMLGIAGTPTFIINGEIYRGHLEGYELEEIINTYRK